MQLTPSPCAWWQMHSSALAFPFEAVTVVNLAAHSIRCPALLRTLYNRANEQSLKLLHPSEVAAWLCKELYTEPFSKQRGGLPFWIGFNRFHFGTQVVLRYLTPKYELKLFEAASNMLQLAQTQTTAAEATTSLQGLPNQGDYAYHAVRSWTAVCRFLRHEGAV